MRLRHQYLIVGIAWALLVGPAAFLLLVGFAAGASWLWLFGDSPWPAATQWALPLIGVIGGALSALACMLIGYEYGKARESRAIATSRTRQRKVIILTVVPLALIVLIGLNGWRESRKFAQDMNLAVQREAEFAALIRVLFRINEITIDHSEHDRFHATVRLKGQREGNYQLHWQVADTSFGTTLVSGDAVMALGSGKAEAEISFTLAQLRQSYRAHVLRGGAGVLVEEPFELDAWLEPVFSESERKTLPPGERRSLGTAESPLRSQTATQFPVRFFIRDTGSKN